MLLRSINAVPSFRIGQCRSCSRIVSTLPFRRPRLTSIGYVSREWNSRITAQRGKTVYPERLLVYHVGVGKTALVGCIKVSTIMAFAFACLVVAPSFYNDPASPSWAPAAVIAMGAFPMIFVASVSAPFVSTIHLHLPPEARISKERMMRYTQLLGPGARLEITAIRLIGSRKTVGTRVSELRSFKSLFSIADLKRVPQKQAALGSSWNFQQKFYVGEKEASKRSRAPGAWDNIMRQIRKNSID
ncbi:hypothetical protein EV356DRAFT_122561 [Viridothelium virens]|uniref:Uncharacterized protein n=1 Tax=Viridothelium virens TaxID=1048519 RepID=A0A6A6HAX5_VIRVR|nr:hypothetical protein EV356DRAFT_122561 [Viridothelium virens]